jgi:hypothetical protein
MQLRPSENSERCFDFAQHDKEDCVGRGGTRPAGNYFSKWLRYFSASIAAAQPDPAAVTACL